MRQSRNTSVTGTADEVRNELMKAREAGGFDACDEKSFPAAVKILVRNGWEATAAEVEVVSQLRDISSKRLTRIERGSGKVAKASFDANAARFLREVLFSRPALTGDVTRLRERRGRECRTPESTLRGRERKILERIAHDFVEAAPNLQASKPAVPGSRRSAIRTPFAGAVGDGCSDLVAALLGRRDVDIVDALYRGAKLDDGFVAQEYGRGTISRASSGMVTYAFSTLPWIGDAVIDDLYDELTDWIKDDGTLAGPNADHDPPNTWAESTVLLAFTGRPHLLGDSPLPSRLANSLADKQADGGWRYRDGSTAPRALLTLYPLLALRRSWNAGWISDARWRSARSHAEEFLHEDIESRFEDWPLESILALRGLQITQVGPRRDLDSHYKHYLDSIAKLITAPDWLRHHRETVTDDNQAHVWHATLSIPALYLASRYLWPKAHAVNIRVGAELRACFDIDEAGWTNSAERNARPYSWATAWGVVAARALARDIRDAFASRENWERKAQMITGERRTRKPPPATPAASSIERTPPPATDESMNAAAGS